LLFIRHLELNDDDNDDDDDDDDDDDATSQSPYPSTDKQTDNRSTKIYGKQRLGNRPARRRRHAAVAVTRGDAKAGVLFKS